MKKKVSLIGEENVEKTRLLNFLQKPPSHFKTLVFVWSISFSDLFSMQMKFYVIMENPPET